MSDPVWRKCPRCDASGCVEVDEIASDAAGDLRLRITWYRGVQQFACDTNVRADDLRKGYFGCGYDD